ncbi:MAG TPA: NUDIX domain-containing protein [Candidatus Saccharimonadales bacterium]
MPHIHELYDFVVAIYIVHDDNVLLVNHPRYGKWLSPGGHIELNEDPEEALYREVAEETGLKVTILGAKPPAVTLTTKPLSRPDYVDVHEANPPHKHISLTYFAKSESGEFVRSAEHTELRWFTASELHDPQYGLDDIVIFYAEQALKAAR